MPFPYPRRGEVTNGFQIAGAALSQTGDIVGEFADKQAKMRQGLDEAIRRRQEAAFARIKYEEEKALKAAEDKRQEEELKIRQKSDERAAKAEERAAADAAKPKPYQPTTQEDALEFERKKAEIRAGNRPTRGPSEGDKSRLLNQANARKMLPAVWEKIDRMWQKQPDAKAYQEEDGTPKTDPMTGLPLRQTALEAWRKDMRALQKELNDAENTAGYPVTRSPFTAARSQSQSFLEYAQSAYPGKYPMAGPAPAAGGSTGNTAAPPPMDEDAAARQWLATNVNPPPGVSPQAHAQLRASMEARLRKSRPAPAQPPFPEEVEDDSLGL